MNFSLVSSFFFFSRHPNKSMIYQPNDDGVSAMSIAALRGHSALVQELQDYISQTADYMANILSASKPV